MSSPRLREQDLSGKVAVVTGASRGIGHAIALNLASRGCSILGTCVTDEGLVLIEDINECLDVLIQEAWEAGDLRASALIAGDRKLIKIMGLKSSLLDPEGPKMIADAIEENFGARVDMFINNAADSRDAVLGELSTSKLRVILALCSHHLSSPIVNENCEIKLILSSQRPSQSEKA